MNFRKCVNVEKLKKSDLVNYTAEESIIQHLQRRKLRALH